MLTTEKKENEIFTSSADVVLTDSRIENYKKVLKTILFSLLIKWLKKAVWVKILKKNFMI